MDEPTEPDSPLGRAFAESLQRVMRVAGEKDDERAPITHERLAALAGVSASLIKRCLNGEAGSTKLTNLEKLAEALGVPPAFLLMRAQDWSALVNAVHTMLQAAPIAESMHSATPREIAEAGVAYVRDAKVVQRKRDFTPADVAQRLRRIESSVANTTVCAPYRHLSADHHRIVLALTALVGTTTSKSNG